MTAAANTPTGSQSKQVGSAVGCPFDPSAVQFDHHDPAWTHENVWSRYAELRELCPVSRSDAHGGYWVLSKYEDVKRAAEDDATYSSAQGMFLPSYSSIRIPLIEFDPPMHTWMRRLVSPMVNAAVAKRMEPDIQACIDELLDNVADIHRVDLVEVFALRLPLHVMTMLWGLSGEQGEDARSYSMEFLEGGAAELQRGVEYWKVIIADRRTSPHDDFVSSVLAANDARSDADGRMADDEMAILMWSLTYAGHDSTALTLANALGHLAEHPEDLATLVADPARLPNAIEELLRFYTPLHQFRRTVTRPTELHGATLAEGDPVLLVYASANRDVAVFDEPDTVHLDRSPNPHMSFGGGIHGCPGRFLARTEIRLALQTVLERYPNFRLLEPAERTGLEGGGRHMGVRRLLVDLQPS